MRINTCYYKMEQKLFFGVISLLAETFISVEDKISPCKQRGFLRSEENVSLSELSILYQYWCWCILWIFVGHHYLWQMLCHYYQYWCPFYCKANLEAIFGCVGRCYANCGRWNGHCSTYCATVNLTVVVLILVGGRWYLPMFIFRDGFFTLR